MAPNSSTKLAEPWLHSMLTQRGTKTRQHEVGKFFRLRLIHNPSSSSTVYQSFLRSGYPPLKPARLSPNKISQATAASTKHQAIHPVPSSFKNESSHLYATTNDCFCTYRRHHCNELSNNYKSDFVFPAHKRSREEKGTEDINREISTLSKATVIWN
jgi:hypothetical protein